jgi:DNA repair photolyase
MIVKEIQSKTILSASKIYNYVINPYVGCQHGCLYCYARFIKKFSGHKESWGTFVDVKINAADLLQTEIKKKKSARIWISGLCDPYQPQEARYRLTRKCLEILAYHNWPVTIQTRSPLVLRDIDIIRSAKDFKICLTITTLDDAIRKIFEPYAPPIDARLNTLDELNQAGIKTGVMIAPILPGAESLPDVLKEKVDYIILDRMNYHYAEWTYRKYKLEDKMTDDYFHKTGQGLLKAFQKSGIDCELAF